jgi:hypothetical protein
MGGDDSQKLLPRRGRCFPSGARYTSGVRSDQLYRKCLGASASARLRRQPTALARTYRPPGSLLPSTAGSLLENAEEKTARVGGAA